MTLTYEDRVIAFVDVLGFGALVERSESDPRLVQGISDALASVDPDALRRDMFATMHHERIPKDQRDEAAELLKLFTEAVSSKHEIRINYFSDSLVISADSSDILATQTVVDLVGRLQVTFWMKHRLLLRGGIAKGQLVHVAGGQLFGPAMNRAYYLESKVAKAPRVILDRPCFDHLSKARTWSLMEPFFDHGDEIGMSLAECYKQLLVYGAQYMNDGPGWRKVRTSLRGAPGSLRAVQNTLTNDNAKSKYDWLIPRVEKLRNEIGTMKYNERHLLMM